MPTVRILGQSGESMIISDPKAEIYYRTAGELEKLGYQIIVLNFRTPIAGNGWNPLSIPYNFYKKNDIDRACEMVNDIANNFITPEKINKDPFWTDSAANMFFGLVLTLFKMCRDEQLDDMTVNISSVLKLRRQLFDENPSMSSIWRYIEDDDIIAPALSGVVLTAKDTRAGIVSTFDQKMRYFVYQPSLMDMLSDNSISLDSINERKTAVYLIMPDEKTTYHVLISLFVKQSYEYLIFQAQESKSRKMKIRLNYILDEFSSLPTIKDFPAMITAARSRDIRFCLIIQSKHQLSQRYGDETETIQSNCVNWIFLTSREVPLLEDVSKLCGKTGGGSRPLVSVASLQHLDKERGQALMMCGRMKPFYAYLPDIDSYDGKDYIMRKLQNNVNRRKRIEIDGILIAKKYVEKDLMPFQKIGKEREITLSNCFDSKKNINKRQSSCLSEKNKVEYLMETKAATEAYDKGNIEQAKEHFIRALQFRSYEDPACDCENNLGYMLRRGEIKSIVIKGRTYGVPDILEKGVRENKAFFLVNMALYISIMGKMVEIKRGEYYIKKVFIEDVDKVREWWENLAQKGEVEGYIVLYWLFNLGFIEASDVGTKEGIMKVMKDKFGIDTNNISRFHE